MTDGRDLLRNISELEKKTPDIVKSGVSADISQHLQQIRAAYKEVIVTHPLLASSKNVDSILWKQCFYKRIEEYRKRIRQFTSSPPRPILVSTASPPTKPTTSLFQLGNDLSIFIAEAKSFYQSLLLELETAMKTSNDDDATTALRKSRHSSLLYLGDLSRYDGLQQGDKKCEEAIKYYSRALRALPESGQPYNQMAVVASYQDSHLDAIYYYARALLAVTPFATAATNLKVVFDKVITLMKNKVESDGNTDTSFKSKSLRGCLLRFLYIHALLFASALDVVQDQIAIFLTDLDTCISNNHITEVLMVKLLTICLFSIHYNRPSDEGTSTRSASESLALTLLLSMMNRLVSRIITQPENARKHLLRFLVPISLFADWGAAHPSYFSAYQGEVQDTMIQLLLAENRIRSSIRSSFAALGGMMSKTLGGSRNQNLLAKIRNAPLKEHVDMMNFMPMRSQYSSVCSTAEPLANIAAQLRRMHSVNCFVQEVLLPTAADDAQKQRSLFIPQAKDKQPKKHEPREDDRLYSSKRMRNDTKRSREKRNSRRLPATSTSPPHNGAITTPVPDTDSDDEVIVFKPAFASSNSARVARVTTAIDATAKSFLETVHHMNTCGGDSFENVPQLDNENESSDPDSESEQDGIDCSDLLAAYTNANDGDIFADSELWDDPTYADEKQWFTSAGEEDAFEQHMDFDGLLSDEVPASHTAPPPGFTVEQQVPLWKQYDQWIHG